MNNYQKLCDGIGNDSLAALLESIESRDSYQDSPEYDELISNFYHLLEKIDDDEIRKGIEETSKSDLESGIFDESNYLDSVLKDIESAKKHVLISSPYLQKNKIAKVKDVLLKTYSSGIRVTLCTNEIVAFPDKQMNYIKEIIEEISGKGIDVIQIKNNRYRFMIIDNRVVWYGGIDILGRCLNEQSLIRIDNEALANELTGIIYEHISQ